MKEFNKDLRKIIITSLILFFLVISIDIFYNICNYNNLMFLTNTKKVYFSLFIILLFFFMFFSVTKKTWKSIAIISTLILIISFINQLKIIYTDEPLAFMDIFFLKNSSELIDIVDESIASSIIIYIPHMIIYTLILIAFCIISYYNSFTVNKKKIRIIMFVVPIIILIFISIPNRFINNVLLKAIFDVDDRVDYNRLTSKKDELAVNGVVSGMYQQLLENRLFEPDNYNENDVLKESSNISETEDNSFGTPNIIVLFAESFWDINMLEEIEFDKKITSNFEALKQKGLFFNMITPSYGGASANVEFEFLTGANMMFFPEGYIPTMRLYNNNNSYLNTPSIIRELKNNGYRTKVVNYTPEASFNINNFYKNILIDEAEFNTKVDEKHYKGGYVSDEYVVDEIIKEFNNKPENEKLFYMTLSMQSHMTYLIDKYENYDIQLEENTYSKEINETLLSYAQGIYDMDLQLKRLYDYVQDLEEPTMLVFFGDHLPYLKTANGENILDYLNYFNTDNELLNIYRRYNTQALILSNFEIEKDNNEYLSPNLLGTYIINKMDINLSQYYKWLIKYINIIPAANWYVTIDQNGKLYYTDELKEKMKQANILREYVQYYYFIRKQ